MSKILNINSGNGSVYLESINKIISDEYGFAQAIKRSIFFNYRWL
jgi:hypothetical protein